MRIAPPGVVPPTADDRCAPLAAGIVRVRKAASIIAIINARIARA
jgi:hypothetical protein